MQRSKRILVVDDDPGIIQIMEANLRRAKFEVTSAHNGAQALSKAYREQPDMILLDVMLFDLDGLEVCRRLKEEPQTSHIPVIIISARAENEDKLAGISAGAEDYLAKPFSPSEVVALVEAHLKRIERGRNANPSTGLLDRTQINSEIKTLIRQNRTFAAIYIDIDSLGIFNNVYGFTQGDHAIHLLAKILLEAVKLYGNPDDVTGHIDSDDFVIISTPQRARTICERIIADFDNKIRTLYKLGDTDRGYIEYETRLGKREQCPIISLSLAVVTNEKRTFDSPLQINEIASELRNYLRRFPGSNYCFDRRDGNVTLQPHPIPKYVSPSRQEEVKNTQGVLAWAAFLTQEMMSPVQAIKDCLNSLASKNVGNLCGEEINIINMIQENNEQMLSILKEFEHLNYFDWVANGNGYEVVNIGKTIEWIKEQNMALAKQRGIDIEVEGLEDNIQLMVNGRRLSHGLFYVLRNEVIAAAFGDRIQIHISTTSEEFLTVDIINRSRYIPPNDLIKLFRSQRDSLTGNGVRNDLYLAKVLVDGFGGSIQVKSTKGDGSIFTICVPKRWLSSAEQINQLRSEVETCSKAARQHVEDIPILISRISPTVRQMPSSIEETLEKLGNRIHELAILCNRSLFLLDDIADGIDKQRERLLQHEAEQLATLETILVVGTAMAKLAQSGYTFSIDSAKRVARNALVIADKLKLSRNEQRMLYCAALLKDLSPTSVLPSILERNISTPEETSYIKECFYAMEQALSCLKSLSPSLSFTKHIYERYDGTGYPSHMSGDQIPLAAKILTIACAFDTLTCEMCSQEYMNVETAVKKLTADSGKRFDPQVVVAFLQAWRNKELQPIST